VQPWGFLTTGLTSVFIFIIVATTVAYATYFKFPGRKTQCPTHKRWKPGW
jgi:hypothetical protein